MFLISVIVVLVLGLLVVLFQFCYVFKKIFPVLCWDFQSCILFPVTQEDNYFKASSVPISGDHVILYLFPTGFADPYSRYLSLCLAFFDCIQNRIWRFVCRNDFRLKKCGFFFPLQKWFLFDFSRNLKALAFWDLFNPVERAEIFWATQMMWEIWTKL